MALAAQQMGKTEIYEEDIQGRSGFQEIRIQTGRGYKAGI
jgi:hypothetical protein